MSLTFRQSVPWYARIVAKLLLSRIPVNYSFWHRLDLFSHGSMDRPSYAHDVFRSHFDRSGLERKRDGFVGLEIGPGDSVMSAVVAAAYGASEYHLVDMGRYASSAMSAYRRMAEFLRASGLTPPDLTCAQTLEDVLASCRAHYGVQGLASLRALPSCSVDFVWSQAVLEHIRRHEFLDTMRELRRVLRGDGVCSHRVDLKDHLGGGLNNLRLGSRLWEQEWMARSGFYTNRLRHGEMIKAFRQAGFSVEIVSIGRWSRSPIDRARLAAEFRHLSDDDLLVKDLDVLLRPA